jgi:hypothetical protein
MRCIETDEWPGYSEADAEPSYYIIKTELEAFEAQTFDTQDEEP